AILALAAAAFLTELLSPYHLLSRWPLAIGWTLILALLFLASRPRFSRANILLYVPCFLIAIPIALAAIISPPNSADAMAYHLPRVIYWAQYHTVAFFPTPYYNQVMLAPLAEYVTLHTYLLTGGDHLVNLIAFAAYCGSVLGVSAIVAARKLPPRAQGIAALVCATLPNAILQASGAKNDFLLTFCLVCAVYFAFRRDALPLALSIALAIFTKATAYLFLPPLLIYVAFTLPRRKLLWIPAAILLINGPQYVRNVKLSGSPLGYDSAQGDGVYRWRNESPGLASLASNALRHTSEQLGARSPRWNDAVYNAVLRAHRALALDPNDPGTTWPGSHFAPPLNANHEANANNRWHLLLYLLAAIFAFATRDRVWSLYAAGLFAAFLFFCLYLKWQPFLARLELPLFVLAAPLAAFFLSRLPHPAIAIAVCLFLIAGTRLPLFENWTRPLKGPHSLFATTRDDAYFNDMSQWNNRASYIESVDRTARSGCSVVAMDITENQLEYPFQALLRERNPRVRFFHSMPGVAIYERPCAVFCPDCVGNERKLKVHGIGPPIEIGRFLLFLAPANTPY
ncbi:MAG: hypothetical protein JWP63_5519, partial [Candidatus Solibacter sp.]|nr:hypothetical protein [Candidatus Solibacter sp.]